MSWDLVLGAARGCYGDFADVYIGSYAVLHLTALHEV